MRISFTTPGSQTNTRTHNTSLLPARENDNEIAFRTRYFFSGSPNQNKASELMNIYV